MAINKARLDIEGESVELYIKPSNGIPSTDLDSQTQTNITKASTALQDEDLASWAKQANPPTYTKSDVGLGNVDNTSDANKPISNATQTALNKKISYEQQTLTSSQKIQARANIQAGSTSASYEDDTLVLTDIPSSESIDTAWYQNIQKALSNDNLALSQSGIVTIPELTWTQGDYVSPSGNLNHSANMAMTAPITVKAPAIIKFKATGYLTSMAMIATPKGTKYQALVLSIDTTEREYQYAVERDMQIVFSCVKHGSYTYSCEIITDVAEIRDVAMNGTLTKFPTLTLNDGFYIDKHGALHTASASTYSDPIEVPANSIITITAEGYLDYMSIIAEYVDVGKYNSLVLSDGSEVKTYTFTTSRAMHIAFSFGKSSSYALTIQSDTYAALGSVKDNFEDFYTNREILDDYVSLSLFEKFGVVGDSFASGEVYDADNNGTDVYRVSWGQIMARRNGTTCTNFSVGGLHTRSWLTNAKGLPLLLSEPAQDVYYLVLGINDVWSLGESYIGTVADIYDDFTQNPDTFYGNYGKIIGNIQNHAPNAKIIMFTVASAQGRTSTPVEPFNAAIIAIAEHFEIPYIVQDDDDYFTSTWYKEQMQKSHPTAINYSGMAVAFERLIKKCVINNAEYFRFMFVGENSNE